MTDGDTTPSWLIPPAFLLHLIAAGYLYGSGIAIGAAYGVQYGVAHVAAVVLVSYGLRLRAEHINPTTTDI